MKTGFTPSAWLGNPSDGVLLFPQLVSEPPAGRRSHFWSLLQAYAEKKRRRIAQAFRGSSIHAGRDNITFLEFPVFETVGPDDQMPPDAA